MATPAASVFANPKSVKTKPAKKETHFPKGRRKAKGEACRARLLLVEDHPPTRTALARLLKARNFEVRAAANVADAWDAVSKAEFDILLSDIGLPDGDGYLLMRELQERCGMRGIALTGYGLDDDKRLSREAGFAVHLVKPIRAKMLDEAFAELGV
jgi:DNA-binding response OmpR family regulator